MKIVTVNVPEIYIEKMKVLIQRNNPNKSLYPSRSELIRAAVRTFLMKEINLSKRLEELAKMESLGETFDDKKFVRIPVDDKEEDLNFKTYKILGDA